MALRDAIRALSEQWDDVEQQLGPEDGPPLLVAMRSLVLDPDDEDLMFEVVASLADVLPRDHAILAAIAIEDTRSTTTPLVWAQVIERLRDIVAKSSW
jgi:hypothetical protein